MNDLVGKAFVAQCARMRTHGLIAAECQSLTGGVPDIAGVAQCGRVDRIERAAYVHNGLRVIAMAATLDDLVEVVTSRSFDADRFRIEVDDPTGRIEPTTHDVVVRLADALPFDPDLDDPLHRFGVVVSAEHWFFGEFVAASDASYRPHEDKPWTTSSSLDSRFSRALVNLVPEARSILDPCCGAGSIVVEAASLGLGTIGVDWKPAMAGMTRENLAHFGLTASIIHADTRSVVQPVDAVVTDLPYGYAIDADAEVTRAILDRCVANAPLGVFVASADITPWLTAAGYGRVEMWTVTKREGFTRFVHRAERA